MRFRATFCTAFCASLLVAAVEGAPAVVPPASSLSVAIVKKEVTINGRRLRLGDSLADWKSALPSEPRCTQQPRVVCTWDEFGIQVDTYSDAPAHVSGLLVQLNMETIPAWTHADTTPDGKPAAPPEHFGPRRAFSGTFRFNGYQIVASTRFRQIRAAADPQRKLRCGLRDCTHPSGRFDQGASLLLRLDRSTDDGKVHEFVVSAGEFRFAERR